MSNRFLDAIVKISGKNREKTSSRRMLRAIDEIDFMRLDEEMNLGKA
jgi:hypothetical protein